jgi:hypothetical protein
MAMAVMRGEGCSVVTRVVVATEVAEMVVGTTGDMVGIEVETAVAIPVVHRAHM